MAASMCPFGTAPTTRPFSTPSWKKTRRGMLMARYCTAVRWFSSTLSLPMRTSLRCDAISSSSGAIIRQGPHHGAQKSTSHFPLPICSAKPASLSVTGWPSPPDSSALHFPQTAFLPLPSSGTWLACPQEGQVMIMRAIFANAVHTATPADLPRLRELFGHANDAPYDLARVAAEKCFQDGVAGPPVTTIFGDFLGASVTCGKYLRILAVHRQHRRLGIGTELLRDAVARGARIVGAEAGNYFTPGVPLASADFFAKRGRKAAETQNLICVTEGARCAPLPGDARLAVGAHSVRP